MFFEIFQVSRLIILNVLKLFDLYLTTRVNKILKILSYIFIFLTIQLGYAQLSRTHYIPPMTFDRSTFGADNQAPHDQYLYISTPSVSPIGYTISRPDGTIYDSGTVSNAVSVEVKAVPSNGDLGYAFIDPSETEQVLTQSKNAGFIIEAESEIYVSFRFNSVPPQYHGAPWFSKVLPA